MGKKIGIIAGIIVVGLVLLKIFGGGGSITSNVDTSYSLKIRPVDNVKGSQSAPVVVVEYSDFQCPACGYYYGFTKQLTQEVGDKIAFVYRNYPLKTIHINAENAALAAEAAKLQGKFWEMHDMLFESQGSWGAMTKEGARDNFISFAEKLGLDVEKFKTDMDSKEVKTKVNDDVALGDAAQVNSTPSFFVNGKLIENPKTYADFKTLISDALADVANSAQK